MNGGGKQKRSHAFEMAVVCLLNGIAAQSEVQEAEILSLEPPQP